MFYLKVTSSILFLVFFFICVITCNSNNDSNIEIEESTTPTLFNEINESATIVEEEKDEIIAGGGGGGINVVAGQLKLPPNYNKFKLPTGNYFGLDLDANRTIWIDLSIRSIGEINEVDEVITFEVDAIVEWYDFGLFSDSFKDNYNHNKSTNYTSTEVTEEEVETVFLTKIWKSNIFLDNLIEVKQIDLLGKPTSLKISSIGLVTFTTRLTFKMDCAFNFKFYPADTQKCNTIVRSYNYNSSEVQLKWKEPIGVYLHYHVDDNYDIAISSIRRFRAPRSIRDKRRDIFDTLQFTFNMRRRLSYQIMQTYIPSMVYIAITWLCFMIPKRMIEARMAIVMTTLLTLTAMFASVRESTPIVSYTKAIDLWMVSCITFVFVILLEFAVLLWTETELHAKNPNPPNPNSDPPENSLNSRKQQKFKYKVLGLAARMVEIIETNSFVLIGIIFITYNSIYWSWLFIGSGYFEWAVNKTHNGLPEDYLKATQEIVELDPF